MGTDMIWAHMGLALLMIGEHMANEVTDTSFEKMVSTVYVAIILPVVAL